MPKEKKPYFTTYPFAQWFWFDVAVYGEFLPHVGDLPTAVFSKLKGGSSCGACRSYPGREGLAEAVADYQQAVSG